MASEALDGGGAEQGRAVLDVGLDAMARVIDIQRKVELGLLQADRQQLQRQFAQSQGRLRRFADVPVEQGLEQRVTLAAALQREVFHDQFDGVVTVFERRQALLPQAAQEGRGGQVRVQLCAVDQAADEIAHQFLGFALVARGAGHADGEVALATVAAQQQLPGPQQDHEWGQATVLAQGMNLLGQLRGQLHPVVACRMLLRGAARIIARQLQRQDLVAQVAVPVVGCTPVACAVQVRLALPVGIVGVLDGRAWQGRGVIAHCALVSAAQIAQQNRVGPGIGNDVVHVQQQHMFLRRQADQRGAHQGRLVQVERASGFSVHHLLQRLAPGLLGQGA
ncbi:hypothetical protein D3C76_473480 [compost metagenome]